MTSAFGPGLACRSGDDEAPRARFVLAPSGYQAAEKPLGQAKWGFGEHAAAMIPQSAPHLSSVKLRSSPWLARRAEFFHSLIDLEEAVPGARPGKGRKNPPKMTQKETMQVIARARRILHSHDPDSNATTKKYLRDVARTCGCHWKWSERILDSIQMMKAR